MKRGVLLALVALALVAATGGSAIAQSSITIVNIPFKFTVDQHRVMEPGKYEVTLNEDSTAITLTPQKGPAVFVPTITRLAVQTPISDGRLVFDNVNEQYALSEVWFPVEDGFLVHDTKVPHKHHIVKGEQKKKGT